MASGQTTNYQLNQWEAEDKVLRTEFNEDNQKIDAALGALAKAVPRIVTGTYTGDGTESRLLTWALRPRRYMFPHRPATPTPPPAEATTAGWLWPDTPFRSISTWCWRSRGPASGSTSAGQNILESTPMWPIPYITTRLWHKG